MAQPKDLPMQLGKIYLLVENESSGRSTCTESFPKEESELKESPAFTAFGSHFVGLNLNPHRRRKRVLGGDNEYCQHSHLLRNPLVVRSGEVPAGGECHPSCPYYQPKPQSQKKQHKQIYDSYPAQENYKQPSRQCYIQPERTPPRSREQSDSECRCDPPAGRRAYRTSSSNYIEYREFQQPPKKNTQYNEYNYEPQRSNRLQKKPSVCSCGAESPPERRRVQRSSRARNTGSECSCESESLAERQPAKRTKRLQRKSSECSCAGSHSPTRRQPIQKRTAPEKCDHPRKTTQVFPTCSVRCHARAHVQKPAPPPAPKRSSQPCAPPPTSMKPTKKPKTKSPKKPPPKRCSEACYYRFSDKAGCVPNDYVERSRSRSEVLRNPLVQYRTSDDGTGMLPHESYSEEYIRRRSPCRNCRRSQSESRNTPRKKPSFCSNETLKEKEVKSFRFSCPENGKCEACRKICPKCNRVQPQKQKSSPPKKFASTVAKKCCPMCGLLPMMPNISIPNMASNNRIIYKTLGKCRPRKVPKTKYELTIFCKKRCQGGRNSHYMTSTIATTLKRRAKAVLPGVNPVAPSRISSHRQGVRQSPVQNITSQSQPAGQPRSQSRSRNSYMIQEQSFPSTSGQQRERSAAPSQVKTRSPSAMQKVERREVERGSAPISSSQQRTRAQSPVVDIQSISRSGEAPRGSHYPKETRTSNRNQPEKEPSYRSYSEPATSSRSQHEPKPSYRVQPDQKISLGSQPAPATSYRSQSEPTTSFRSQAEPAPSNRSRSEPRELPAYLLEPEILEPTRRGASYLGTEVNPFYRGSFLRVRNSMDSPPSRFSPIHQRGITDTEPKPPKAPKSKVKGLALPSKYNRLTQLHAWVFGDPFVKGNKDLGTWSWRQIFGRSKKRSSSKSKPAKTTEGNI